MQRRPQANTNNNSSHHTLTLHHRCCQLPYNMALPLQRLRLWLLPMCNRNKLSWRRMVCLQYSLEIVLRMVTQLPISCSRTGAYSTHCAILITQIFHLLLKLFLVSFYFYFVILFYSLGVMGLGHYW